MIAMRWLCGLVVLTAWCSLAIATDDQTLDDQEQRQDDPSPQDPPQGEEEGELEAKPDEQLHQVSPDQPTPEQPIANDEQAEVDKPDEIQTTSVAEDDPSLRFVVAVGVSVGIGTGIRTPQTGNSIAAGRTNAGRSAAELSILIAARRLPVSPELALREGFVGSVYRSVVDVGARFFLANRPHTPSVRIAWVHLHQDDAIALMQSPFATIFGTSDSIDHRTGFGFGAALEFPRRLDRFDRSSRIRGFVSIDTQIVWGDAPNPQGAVLISGGVWVGLGPRTKVHADVRSSK